MSRAQILLGVEMDKLTLLLDMDGVMADLLPKWISYFNHHHEKQITLDMVTSYSFKFLTRGEKLELKSYLEIPGFFQDMDVIGNSVEVVRKLHKDGHRIIVVTAGFKSTNADDKLIWLEKNYPFLGSPNNYTVFTKRKEMVRGHLLFDDSPRYIDNFNKAGGLTCIMDTPYNQANTTADFRVYNNNWDDFYTFVNSI